MEVMEGLVLDKHFAIEFGIQLVIFLASFIVMKVLVFNPLMELIHVREEKTEGLQKETELAKQKMIQIKADYDSFIKEEYRKSKVWMDQEKKKLALEESKIVGAARDEAAQKLEELRKQIGEQTDKTRKELDPLISDFAGRIAGKLIGKPVSISGVDSAIKKNLTNQPVIQG